MQLFIGGAKQDKLNTVLALMPENDKIKEDLIFDCASYDADFTSFTDVITKYAVLNHFHEFVRRFSDKFADRDSIEELLKEISEKNPKLIIIGDEIGYGIVPLDAKEREYRENYGRTMCCIAGKAGSVTRIVCGIPQVIKA